MLAYHPFKQFNKYISIGQTMYAKLLDGNIVSHYDAYWEYSHWQHCIMEYYVATRSRLFPGTHTMVIDRRDESGSCRLSMPTGYNGA